ncbi:MAG: hypothetical protein U0869_22520 [Chloroflexota bacterium]
MRTLARSRSFRRLQVGLLLAAIVGLSPAAPASAGSIAFNGECRFQPSTPAVESGQLWSIGKIGCIHYVETVDARVQLWRVAGAPGRKGDVLLADTGWTTLPITIVPPYGQRLRVTADCRPQPRTMQAYARYIIRSKVVRQGGSVQTSAWAMGEKATVTC